MKVIQLSKGQLVQVDDEDYNVLSGWSWTSSCVKGKVYARRNNRGVNVLMHRLLINALKGEYVDHRDGNTLNNQKSNLRKATNGQNMSNRGKTRKNKSGYKGVYFDKEKQRWAALIAKDKHKYPLGRFDSPEDAARAYDVAALRLHGEFALTNF